ncbi:MAG: SulP family inorganic anion transporter [Myxococcales bacterium]|nr:SulP family inorganic anion transporter [Myxococcales bacterium]
MVSRLRGLPFLDLSGYSRAAFAKDATAAATVTFLAIPQCLAYAMIAGLPPVVGLYAAAVPSIVGALLRSSRHVMTGPSNALSLLVGTVAASAADLDPVSTVLLLALIVGALQVAMGSLRLGVLVDYISIPVVVGYITGAGILIAAGQLHHLTGTPGGRGSLIDKVTVWASHLSDANLASVAIGVVTAAGILGLRRLDRRIPGALLVPSAMTALAFFLDAPARFGVETIRDLDPIPTGLPPLTIPWRPEGHTYALAEVRALLPAAVAITVLSVVESSAVARAIALKTGQRLDLSFELFGQGAANVASAFFGGYPISGSLARSTLNHRTGAVSRLSGVMMGAFVLVALLGLGPVVNHTPVAALAGLLMVVASDLVDVGRIRTILRARRSDLVAFLATLASTWTLRLDHAIYVGVAVSVFLFMRRARVITVHHVAFDEVGRPMDLREDDPRFEARRCRSVRMLQVEGQLFFGAVGELTTALDAVVADPTAKVVCLRLRRAFGMDATIAELLEGTARRLREEGRHLVIMGVRPDSLEVLRRTGALAAIGEDAVFEKTDTWFSASDAGLAHALALLGEHDCKAPCPIRVHLDAREAARPR